MGIFNRFRNAISAFVASDTATAGEFASTSVKGRELFPPFDHEEGLKLVRFGIVNSCAEIIGINASAIPWVTKKKNSKGEEEIIEDPNHHFNMLLKNPNPLYTWTDIIQLWSLVAIGTGQFYLFKNLIREDTRVSQLEPLTPPNVRIVVGLNGFISRYRFENGAGRSLIPPEKIVHYRHRIDPLNAFMGLAPIESMFIWIQISNEMDNYQFTGLKNGTGKGLAMLSEGSSRMHKQFKSFVADIREAYSGSSNSGKVMVMPPEVKEIVEYGANMDELQFTESKHAIDSKICGKLGVPHLILVPEGATFANLKEATKNMFKQSIIPFMKDVRDTLNKSLPSEDGSFLDFDTSNVESLQTDFAEKIASGEKLWGMGVPLKDVNQKLGLGLEDRPGYEQSFIPANLQPADLFTGDTFEDQS